MKTCQKLLWGQCLPTWHAGQRTFLRGLIAERYIRGDSTTLGSLAWEIVKHDTARQLSKTFPLACRRLRQAVTQAGLLQMKDHFGRGDTPPMIQTTTDSSYSSSECVLVPRVVEELEGIRTSYAILGDWQLLAFAPTTVTSLATERSSGRWHEISNIWNRILGRRLHTGKVYNCCKRG